MAKTVATQKSSERKKLERELLEQALHQNLTPKELRSVIEAAKHPSSHPGCDLSSQVRNNELTIGIVSDTCLNSKYERLDILHTAYRWFKDLNVPYVLHCGNVVEKYLAGPTHVDHVIYQSYDRVLDHIKKVYPNIGVPTYFIGGRNERSYFARIARNRETGRSEKTNICADLHETRKDLSFIGWHNARVLIAPKTTLALASPKSGSRKPYTISHPIQKIIESYGGGEKPDIQVVGYFNQRWNGVHVGVEAHMIGTMQNQPPENYSDAEPSHTLGALVLKLQFNKNGTMAQNGIRTGEIPFYE